MSAATILNVASPLNPVSLDADGGSAQVVALLDREIARAGRRTLVVAPEGSRVTGELFTVPRLDDPTSAAARRASAGALRHALTRLLETRAIDVVHLHGAGFRSYLPPPGVPVLVTLHLPLERYPDESLHPDRLRTFLCGVSNAQIAGHPAAVRLLGAVPCGIDLEAFRPLAGRRTHIATVSTIGPNRGVERALDAAHRAGAPLLLAGHLGNAGRGHSYFAGEIARRLDHHRRYLGPITVAQRRRLLARARCLLVASRAPQPTSLPAMEALACGTPVVAFRVGALADLVEDGKTGVLVDHEDELADAIERTGAIDPATCRAAALARFSVRRTGRRYLGIYDRLVAGKPGRVGPKTSRPPT